MTIVAATATITTKRSAREIVRSASSCVQLFRTLTFWYGLAIESPIACAIRSSAV